MAKATLTDKQERFCQEYLLDLNATAAYIRAGYATTGAGASVNASRLLANAKVQTRVAELQAERSRRTEISADRVLLEYARLAFSDMREFTAWGSDGVKWKDSEALSDDAAACVAEVVETRSAGDGGWTRRFKLHSKTAALSDVAKHLGMFVERGTLEVTGKDGGPVEHSHIERQFDLAAEIRDIDRHIAELSLEAEASPGEAEALKNEGEI